MLKFRTNFIVANFVVFLWAHNFSDTNIFAKAVEKSANIPAVFLNAPPSKLNKY